MKKPHAARPVPHATAALAAALATAFAIIPAAAQPVSGLYIGAGAGANFMGDESFSLTERVGSYSFSNRFGTRTYPASNFGYSFPIPFDTGGVAVLSAGYGLGNGLRLEIEGDYRINAFSQYRGFEQKFGGMLNAVYDLPLNLFGITPYAGLGAGYMWADRGRDFPSTSAFAYQAILGGSLPVPFVPGLSATFEYRFMGLAGADRSFTEPGYNYGFYTQSPSDGRRKFSDDFNHSLLIGLRYAFNPAPNAALPPVGVPTAPLPVAARTYLVFFDWDRADLTDRARAIIAQAAQATTSVQVTRIEVSGNTDTSGTPRYNQVLSIRRAESVAAELVRLGVPRAAITTQGFGATRLLVPTGPGIREPQNRRVEIVLR